MLPHRLSMYEQTQMSFPKITGLSRLRSLQVSLGNITRRSRLEQLLSAGRGVNTVSTTIGVGAWLADALNTRGGRKVSSFWLSHSCLLGWPVECLGAGALESSHHSYFIVTGVQLLFLQDPRSIPFVFIILILSKPIALQILWRQSSTKILNHLTW